MDMKSVENSLSGTHAREKSSCLRGKETQSVLLTIFFLTSLLFCVCACRGGACTDTYLCMTSMCGSRQIGERAHVCVCGFLTLRSRLCSSSELSFRSPRRFSRLALCTADDRMVVVWPSKMFFIALFPFLLFSFKWLVTVDEVVSIHFNTLSLAVHMVACLSGMLCVYIYTLTYTQVPVHPQLFHLYT